MMSFRRMKHNYGIDCNGPVGSDRNDADQVTFPDNSNPLTEEHRSPVSPPGDRKKIYIFYFGEKLTVIEVVLQ